MQSGPFDGYCPLTASYGLRPGTALSSAFAEDGMHAPELKTVEAAPASFAHSPRSGVELHIPIMPPIALQTGRPTPSSPVTRRDYKLDTLCTSPSLVSSPINSSSRDAFTQTSDEVEESSNSLAVQSMYLREHASTRTSTPAFANRDLHADGYRTHWSPKSVQLSDNVSTGGTAAPGLPVQRERITP